MTRAKSSTTFRAVLRGEVWEVRRDSAFYGDYLSREQAIQGACLGARAVESRGGAACVLVDPGGKVVPH
jgi:hypothetical protein